MGNTPSNIVSRTETLSLKVDTKLKGSGFKTPFISKSEKLEDILDIQNYAEPGENKIKRTSAETSTDQEEKTYSLVMQENEEGPKVWVKRWVDYSSKYGLGYLLSNYCTGVYFNDSTKIISDPCGSYFQYIHRPQTAELEEASLYTFKDFPSDLQKKVKLLLHFRKYLIGDDTIQETKMSHPLTYVKKWLRISHGIMFRLSNKIVQVNFQDKTELLISSESKFVSYVNEKGERNTYPLNSAMECANSEMVRKLRDAKDVLTSIPQLQFALTEEYRTQTTERDL